MDQQQQLKTSPEATSQDTASALQTEELLNSLLLQGAFGTPATPRAATPPMSETAAPTEEQTTKTFVNKGLALWELKRREWLNRNTAVPEIPRHAMDLDVDEVIDTLFASSRPNTTPKYFSTSIPLPQMIDILQDLWEAEGLET